MKFFQIEDTHIDLGKIDFIQEEPQHQQAAPMIVVYYIGRHFRIRSDSPKWTELQALLPSTYLRIQGAHIDVREIAYVREEAQSQGQPLCVIYYHDRELRIVKGSSEWNELVAVMYPEA